MIPDRIEEGFLTRMLLWILPGILIAALSCLLFIPEYRQFASSNRVDAFTPYQFLIPVAAAVFLHSAWRMYRSPTKPCSPGPLIGVSILSYLFLLRPEATHPWMTLILATIASLCIACSSAGRKLNHALTSITLSPLLALGGMIVLYTLIASFLSYLQLMHFRVPSFDLATYHHLFHQSLSGAFLETAFQRGGTHLSSHCDPFMILLALGYHLIHEVEYLLVVQSLFLALSIIPLYGIARIEALSHHESLCLCLCFLLQPALHGMNFYEFHSLVFACPFIMLFMYAERSNHTGYYWLSVVALLLIREDMSLLLIALSLYHLNRYGRLKRSLTTIGLALLYLLAIKIFIMPDSGLIMDNSAQSISFRKEFSTMLPFEGQGAFSLLISFVTNPLFVLSLFVREAVVHYWALLLLPLMGAALFARGAFFALAYGILFSGLSSNALMHSVEAQYSTYLLPILFALTPEGVERLRTLLWPQSLNAFLPAMLICSLFVSMFFGGIFPNYSFRIAGNMLPAHFRSEDLFGDDYKEAQAAREMISMISDEEDVCVTRFLAPLVANRSKIRLYVPGKKCKTLLIRQKTLKPHEQDVFKTGLLKREYQLIKASRSLLLLQKN